MGNQKTGNKTCLSVTLPTKNVTWSDHALKKQNMFVNRYFLTIQFLSGMRAVICRYLGKGGG